MKTTLQVLGAAALAAGLALGCDDGYAEPVIGAGCSDDQQSSVALEGGMLVTRVFLSREYTQVTVVSNSPTTYHYRACQLHTCTEVRESADPLTETEIAGALSRCEAEADAAWAAEHPT